MTTRLCLLFICLLGLTGCFGGGGETNFPNDPAEVRRQVSSNLGQIQLHLNAEAVHDADDFVSDLFVMQPEVAALFQVGPFSGSGRSAFRSFFERVHEEYGDFVISFTINSIDVDDDVATAHVRVTFSGDRVDMIPPEGVSWSEDHVLVFEWENNAFRLVNWGVEEDHNQGGGGTT
jgi:hypothetical protein